MFKLIIYVIFIIILGDGVVRSFGSFV